MLDYEYGLEESILKICSINRDIANHVATLLSVESFDKKICKSIFLAIKDGLNNPSITDEISLIQSMPSDIEKDALRNIIVESRANVESINDYCNSHINNYNKRRLNTLLTNSKKSITDDGRSINEIIVDISDNLQKISLTNKEYELEDIGVIYNEIIDSLDKPSLDIVGIGLPELTNRFGEIFLGSFVGIIARPSIGKTAMAVESLVKLAIDNENPESCLVFSLETDRKRFAHRLISNMSGIPCSRLKEGYLTEEEMSSILSARDKFHKSGIKLADIYDTSINQIVSVSRREKLKNKNLNYIYIDYLQLIDVTNSGSNRNSELTIISRKLKMLAKELNVVVICMIQPNRACEHRENKRPVLSDIRDCITGSTHIYMADGSVKSVKELYDSKNFINESLFGLDFNNKISVGKIKDIWKSDKKKIVSVMLASGKEFKCSEGHRFYINGEWINIGKAKKNDLIATPRVMPEPKDAIAFDKQEIRMLGYLLADGCLVKSSPKFATSNLKNKEEIIDIAKNYFDSSVNEYDRNTYFELQFTANGNRWHHKGLQKWCDEIGISGMRSHTKAIPDNFMNCTNESAKELLHSLWSCDGHTAISNNRNLCCFYSTNSVKLKDQIVLLLNRFGIIARVRIQKKEGYRDVFAIYVSGVDQLKLFFSNIGLPNNALVSEEDIVDYLKNKTSNTNVDIVPIEFKTFVRDRLVKLGMSLKDTAQGIGYCHTGNMFSKHSNWSNSQFSKISSYINDEEIAFLAESEIFWDKIIKIEFSDEEEEMYDISVDSIETFMNSGCIAHNCGAIEQDLDLAIALYRDDYYNENSAESGIMELIVLKNKDGGRGTVKMRHDLPCNKFLPYEGNDFEF